MDAAHLAATAREEREEAFALQELVSVDDLAKLTVSNVSGGMPENLVAFAVDVMGNVFCFARLDVPTPDSPVLLFDHEYGVEIERRRLAYSKKQTAQ